MVILDVANSHAHACPHCLYSTLSWEHAVFNFYHCTLCYLLDVMPVVVCSIHTNAPPSSGAEAIALDDSLMDLSAVSTYHFHFRFPCLLHLVLEDSLSLSLSVQNEADGSILSTCTVTPLSALRTPSLRTPRPKRPALGYTQSFSSSDIAGAGTDL